MRKIWLSLGGVTIDITQVEAIEDNDAASTIHMRSGARFATSYPRGTVLQAIKRATEIREGGDDSELPNEDATPGPDAAN